MAHLVELLVDLNIIVFVVLTKLSYDSAIGQRHKLCVDLVNPCPLPVSDVSWALVGPILTSRPLKKISIGMG